MCRGCLSAGSALQIGGAGARGSSLIFNTEAEGRTNKGRGGDKHCAAREAPILAFSVNSVVLPSASVLNIRLPPCARTPVHLRGDTGALMSIPGVMPGR